MNSERTFVNLKPNERKGMNGSVIILGGSQLYTGAPLFTGLGALRSGAELVYIFTTKDAVQSIKRVDEIIVSPIEFNSRILDKATACVFGPGLGRISDETLKIILEIVNYLDSKSIPLIFDADSIHYYKKGIFNHLTRVILTPNYKEAVGLHVCPGHICIYKGKEDLITHHDDTFKVDSMSSQKRCGGQGDILSGILATAVSINGSDLIDACISSCKLLRLSARLAFGRMGFSLITSDILEDIPKALFIIRGDSKHDDVEI